MNLAALLIPPTLDAKQALRLRRFGVAALSYVLAAALVANAWIFGVLPASAMLASGAVFLAINLGLYAVIRSGINLRFEDPSLTRFQILVAITILMYIVYHMDAGRSIALSACFMIFLFGTFRLDTREFAVVTLYALAAYALVINLLMHLRPQAIDNVRLEWMSWVGLAGFLPCFAFIGAQVNALRRRMRRGEARFRSLTEMSSDFYWESDAEHRLTDRSSADRKVSSVSVFRQGAQIGERRWEIPHLSPDEAGWRAHRAELDAHRPFRDFELSRLGADGTERHILISGDPLFDASGTFTGYRGVGRDITERKRAESALRESEARFRLTFELAGSGIAHVSLDGHLLRVNRSLCAILGYTAQDLVGRNVKELSHPEDRDKTDAARVRMRAGELESMRSAKRYLRKDGSTVWVDLSVALARDADGKPLYEVAVFDDDTVRMQSEQALRASAEKLRMFADNVPAMTASYDENLRCRFANKMFAEFFGIGAEHIIGKHAREILGDAVYREVESYFAQVLLGHPVTYRRTSDLRIGESHYLEIKVLPHIGDDGKILGCFVVMTDITEHKLAEERIQRLAHHDSLTGLPNRLLFDDRLHQAISLAKRDARQCALLYLDLDKFKPVNDALGHAAGDELLRAVAARIREQVRESDTLARVGGDEFTVILPGATREEAETVARKIIAALVAPFLLGVQKQSVGIGTSIGIAVYPADAADADALVKAADVAMYRAKQAGNDVRLCAA